MARTKPLCLNVGYEEAVRHAIVDGLNLVTTALKGCGCRLELRVPAAFSLDAFHGRTRCRLEDGPQSLVSLLAFGDVFNEAVVTDQ